MTTPAAVSIICCALDGERFLDGLRRDLDAVLTDECELVLVDDGSTDGTGAAFDRWAEELPRVVVVHHERPHGLGRTQAEAVAAATGEWLWMIDCDDRFPADALRTLLDAARRDDADVVVGRARSVDTDGHVLNTLDADAAPAVLDARSAMEQVLLGGIKGYTWTKLLRRSLFDEATRTDGFAPPLIDTQCDFCRIVTGVARSRVVTLLDDVVYDYVRHGSSMMDASDPPLDNLVIAERHALHVARAVLPESRRRRALLAHFTTWFLAASAIQIPFYVRAGSGSKRHGRRIARRTIRGVRPLDVLAIDRVVGVEAVLLRISPRLYQLVFGLTHRPTVG